MRARSMGPLSPRSYANASHEVTGTSPCRVCGVDLGVGSAADLPGSVARARGLWAARLGSGAGAGRRCRAGSGGRVPDRCGLGLRHVPGLGYSDLADAEPTYRTRGRRSGPGRGVTWTSSGSRSRWETCRCCESAPGWSRRRARRVRVRGVAARPRPAGPTMGTAGRTARTLPCAARAPGCSWPRASPANWDDQRVFLAAALTSTPPLLGYEPPDGIKGYAEVVDSTLDTPGVFEPWSHLNPAATDAYRWSVWMRFPEVASLSSVGRRRPIGAARRERLAALRARARHGEEAEKANTFGF